MSIAPAHQTMPTTSTVPTIRSAPTPAPVAPPRRPARGRRVAGLIAGLALGLTVLAGCDSQGAQTDCSLDACTVTFDRGVDARVNILGVEAKLLNSEGDRVTLEVAGEQITLTTGQAATEVGGLWASVESADDQQVVVRLARNAN